MVGTCLSIFVPAYFQHCACVNPRGILFTKMAGQQHVPPPPPVPPARIVGIIGGPPVVLLPPLPPLIPDTLDEHGLIDSNWFKVVITKCSSGMYTIHVTD